MTVYNVTISIGFSIVGVEPATLWNSGNWGTIVWGSSGDWRTDVIKGIDNSLSPTTTLAFQVQHAIDNSLVPDSAMGFQVQHAIDNALVPDSDVGKLANRTLDNTFTTDSDMGSEVLQDGSGWTYIFPSDADDGEERDDTTWTSGAAAAGSWASQAVTSTTWS